MRDVHGWRTGLAGFSLSVAGGLAALILLLPEMKPDKPGAVAILLFLAGIILIGRGAWRRPGAGGVLFLLSVLIIFPFAVIYRAFGQIDMMSLLFPINVGTAGVSPMIFRSEIIAVALALAVLAGAIFFSHACRACAGFLLSRRLPSFPSILSSVTMPWAFSP